MNKQFEEFIEEMKGRLLAYEMDWTTSEKIYDKQDISMMKRLREALYPESSFYQQFSECHKDSMDDFPMYHGMSTSI